MRGGVVAEGLLGPNLPKEVKGTKQRTLKGVIHMSGRARRGCQCSRYATARSSRTKEVEFERKNRSVAVPLEPIEWGSQNIHTRRTMGYLGAR